MKKEKLDALEKRIDSINKHINRIVKDHDLQPDIRRDFKNVTIGMSYVPVILKDEVKDKSDEDIADAIVGSILIVGALRDLADIVGGDDHE